MPISYISKKNKRLLGSELLIVNEPHTVGITSVATTTPDYIRLIEVPLQESPSSVIIPGFTEVTTIPGTLEFIVDYLNGRILFNSVQNGTTQFVTYKGRGSEVDAEDVNELQQPLSVIANLNGTLSAGIVKPNNISTVITDNFTFPNDVTVNGDLDVKGTMTTVESTIVTIEDPVLELNKSNPTSISQAGFLVHRDQTDSVPPVQLVWDETLMGWTLGNTSGGSILTTLDIGNVGIGTTTPLAKLHNTGSTIFGLTSATDPGSLTTSQVDNFSGIVITTTGAVPLTVPFPTSSTAGRLFTIIHNDTSTGSLVIDGKNINVGQGTTLMWDGSFWSPVGGGAGGFAVAATLPGSPTQGDTIFLTTTNQFMGYNGSSWVILG